MRPGGLVFIVLGLLVVSSSLRSQQHTPNSQEPLLGSTIPDLPLRTAEGETVALSHVLRKGVAVLLLVPAQTTEMECEALRKTVTHLSSALGPLGISLISVSFGTSAGSPSGCALLGNAHFIADPQRWILHNLGSQGARTSALLVDQQLGIRRVFQLLLGRANAPSVGY
jgi:peroxiredoxin